MREVLVMLLLMLLLLLRTLEVGAEDAGLLLLLLGEVLTLLQEAQVVDEVAVPARGRLLLDGRYRGGGVGVARGDELRPGQGPSARPGPRQGLEIRVYLHQVWLLDRFRHGRVGVIERGEPPHPPKNKKK